MFVGLICANISSNQQDIYTNSQNIIQTKYTLSSSNNTSLHIGGGRAPVPAEFYQGDIGDLFVFNRALTNTEHANMTNYLTNKWLGYSP